MNTDSMREALKIENLKPVSLLFTIVDRGKGDAVTGLYRSAGITYSLICPCHGAAGSDLLDYLGLTSSEKDIVLSVSPAQRAHEIMALSDSLFHFELPGTGLVFCIPITGVSGPKALNYISGAPYSNTENSLALPQDEKNKKKQSNLQRARKEGERQGGTDMHISRDYDLIVTVVNRGFADQVIDAAKEAGAAGGTVFYARGTGIHEVEKFFAISIQPEKEVVLSLVKHPYTRQIMHSIIAAAGLTTEGRGLSFALPVSEVMGVVHDKPYEQDGFQPMPKAPTQKSSKTPDSPAENKHQEKGEDAQ